jgi:DHA1 family multidrug resistance protein-like MFS transporter
MDLWRRNLYTLWGTQFLAMVGMNLVVPFLPFYIRDLGVSDPQQLARWSGLVFAGPFFVSFFAIPLWGTLGDRYGRKVMVVRAIIGLGISQALIGLAQSPLQLFLFRMVQGGISGFIASSLALVSTNTPRSHIGYALGFMQSSTAAGMVLGPFIGGVLADLIGYREIFFITASLCFTGGLFVLVNVKEVTRPDPEAQRYTVFDNIRLVAGDRRLRMVALTLVVGQMSILMIEPIFALFIESFHTDTEYISTLAGGMFSISGFFMVLSAPWWGKRNDRIGFKRNLAIGFAVVGLVYGGHLIVADLVQLGFLRAFLGFARGGTLPALYSLTSLFAPPERRGGIMAIASSMTILGNMLGPMIGGLVAAEFGIAASFATNGLLLIIMSVVIWRFFEDPPPDIRGDTVAETRPQ